MLTLSRFKHFLMLIIQNFLSQNPQKELVIIVIGIVIVTHVELLHVFVKMREM